MNNKIQPSIFRNEKDQFLVGDRARLLAELAHERECTKQAQLDLVYSKRFYRILVGILLVLIALMYGGLWYVKYIKEVTCL